MKFYREKLLVKSICFFLCNESIKWLFNILIQSSTMHFFFLSRLYAFKSDIVPWIKFILNPHQFFHLIEVKSEAYFNQQINESYRIDSRKKKISITRLNSNNFLHFCLLSFFLDFINPIKNFNVPGIFLLCKFLSFDFLRFY